MKWIKRSKNIRSKKTENNLSDNQDNFNKKFRKENNHIILLRIRIICISIIILSMYYLYVDFIAFKELEGTSYLTNLRAIHFIIFLGSALYLIFYEYYKKNKDSIKDIYLNLSIKIYLIATLLIGSLSSLNSQNLTGNMDSYIIVSVLVAVAFPLEPIFMFLSLFINHAIFIIGLMLEIENKYELVTKQINSTIMIVMAYILVVISYKYRKEDYYNKSNIEKLFDINPYPLIMERFKDGEVIKLNKKLLEFYNMSSQDIKSLNISDLYSNKEERQKIMDKLEKEGNISNYILEHKTKDGLSKWVIANYEVINYKGEKCILCGMTDITELKKMENELIKNAATDVLTGAYNRRKGMDILKGKLKENSQRTLELVICFIDINRLKYVNDNYGHSEGDYYITTVCKILKSEIKEDDLLFRFGGDEFVIAFENKSIEEVNEIWNKIHLKFDNLNNSKHKSYKVTVSHGIYKYSSNMPITLEEAINLADGEMYRNKFCSIE